MEEILRYRNSYLKPDPKLWRTALYQKKSYGRYTIEELISRILDAPTTPIEELIGAFLWELGEAECGSYIKEFIFDSAIETLEDLSDYLKGKKL